MLLIGRNRSPFSRRVAVSLRILGLEYEHHAFTAWTHLGEVRKLNPVGRVPALVLDDGEVLFDSAAILDYLDGMVGPDRALIPALEPERRRVLRIVACAMGVLEKVVAVLYANTMYPPEKLHQPWVAHNEAQAASGLRWLNNLPNRKWLAGDRISQADVTTAVMLDFTRIVNPAMLEAEPYPRLESLLNECRPLRAFLETYPADDVDRSNPMLPTLAP
jgi:glutathione S-transferase